MTRKKRKIDWAKIREECLLFDLSEYDPRFRKTEEERTAEELSKITNHPQEDGV